MNRIQKIIADARAKAAAGDLNYETGLEGRPMNDMPLVACPVSGKRTDARLCEDCAYFVFRREMDAGKDAPKKIGIICAAPRLLICERVWIEKERDHAG